MPPAIIAAGIGAVGAVGSGIIASSAAKKAANTQAQAAKDAAAAQERAAALALEAQKTGNAEALAAAKEAAAKAQEAQDRATQAAQDYARASFQDQQKQFEQTYGAAQDAYQNAYTQQMGLQNPYREAGLTAQQQMMQLLGLGGDTNAAGYGRFAGNFDNTKFEQDPGYAFRQEEGMRALERSAAARGGLLSGNMLKGVQRFSQGLASQEYQNAFNRYQTERASQLGALQPLMGAGQNAANVMTNAAGAYGQNTAQNAFARGAANVGNIQNLYGTQSNLALQQGENTARNAYNVAQAAQQGAMNLGNAGATAAYNVGNAQAAGLTNAAQARASGYVGSSNAMANALGSIGSAAANYPLYQAQINYLNSGGGSGSLGNMAEIAKNIGGGFNTTYNPLPFTGN